MTLSATWRLWRHCCCRYGWYPVLIVPVITSGCLLSLYSSFGCDFVQLEVGFTPSNQAWNQSTAHLGLFYMYTGVESGNRYERNLLEGCEWYSDAFEFSFIEGDRTWKVARIMALISGAASITATMTSWLFLFSPLPVSLFWPGLLLPAVLVSFLAEGSKFLMFDTAVCRTALWAPTGIESLPQRAESCDLGGTAVHTIISGCIFFISLMFVCLKAPDKRPLDEDYGQTYDDKQHPPDAYIESGIEVGVDCESQGSYPRGSDVYIVGESASHTDRSLGDFESVGGRSVQSGRSGRSGRSRSSKRSSYANYPRRAPELTTVRSESSSANSDNFSYGGRHGDVGRHTGYGGGSRDGRESRSARRTPEESSREGIADPTETSKHQSGIHQHGNNRLDPAGFGDRMSAAEIAIRRSEQQRISESRVSKIEKMELSTTTDSEDLIEKFVSDLNLSFQQDEGESELPSSLLDMTSSLGGQGKRSYLS